MSKILWKSLLASPVALGTAFALSASAIASEVEANNVTVDDSVSVSALEQINQYSNEGDNAIAQVTSVSQLSDVQPTDWAFQALQSLVERYGCIAGYPDGTYRGNRAMTRYEFAAGLNACLDRILEIVTVGGEIGPEDLATIRRLQEEFAAELATLRGRVDSLEARTAELEANQFSTTTKLNGEVIFNVYGGGQGDNITGLITDATAVDGESSEVAGVFTGTGISADDEDQVAFGYRARLNFDASFTGQDRLRVRLQARDQDKLATDPTGFSFGGGSGDDARDDITLDDLFYTFPLGERVEVIVGANSLGVDDFVASTISPFDSSGQGGLNDFSGPLQYDLFDNGNVGAGAIVQLTDNVSLDFGYTAGEANDPTRGSGLFNGDYSAIGQLTYLSDFIDAALTYVHSYSGDSKLALDAFSDGTVGNTYAGQINFKFDSFEIGGGASYTTAIELGYNDTEIWQWNAGVAFPDLGGEGNLLGIYGGQIPSFGRAFTDLFGTDFDQQYLVEAFYNYQVNDNVSLTPGVIWVINPAFNSDNEDTVIGALRTTFRF